MCAYQVGGCDQHMAVVNDSVFGKRTADGRDTLVFGNFDALCFAVVFGNEQQGGEHGGNGNKKYRKPFQHFFQHGRIFDL